MISVRYLNDDDKEFWYSLDRHLPETEFDNKVRTKTGYVVLKDGEPAGLLRYNLFWDNTPFCTMLYIDEKYRGQGLGTRLMERWENDMRSRGYTLLLTSTQSDETAQHFYRKLGYADCGCLLLDSQAAEIFFGKAIK